MSAHRTTTEFPVHCIEPIPGEDLTWVLYGSGGCSLYDTAKLRAIGGMDEVYEPAYVEDLDPGVRGWQRGWPTVFVAGARTVHDHRTTTSRYYSEDELARVLERNYLRFLFETVSSSGVVPKTVDGCTRPAESEGRRRARRGGAGGAGRSCRAARRAGAFLRYTDDEHLVFALGRRRRCRIPGRAPRQPRPIAVASCYIPFPLSHGGAVRMYNLMRRASADVTQVLLTFVDELHTPPRNCWISAPRSCRCGGSGAICSPTRGQPDAVDDFDSPAFRAALAANGSEMEAAIAQLEFTQMAQYAARCAPQRRAGGA